jgi:hypothetical protein
VVTLYNGNSVYLGGWYIDQSGLCGINGDPYVWQIWWNSPTSAAHWAVIGDWYLATGSGWQHQLRYLQRLPGLNFLVTARGPLARRLRQGLRLSAGPHGA